MITIGNQKTIKLLDRIVEKGKIANAYLFLGPENVGKFTTALEFARKLIFDLSTDSTSSPQVNSDLIIIAPEIEEKKGVTKKLDIKIEAIRELQHKLSLTSTGGKYKAVIIDDAQKLNKTAQNALLKTLEEPNEKVVLILVAQNEKKILPTVASRCQKIKFSLVDDGEIAKIIPSEASDRDEIIFWSVGRPGIAKLLISDSVEMEFRKKSLHNLRGLFAENSGNKFSLAESASKDMPTFLREMNLWLIVLRQAVLGQDENLKVSPAKALRLSEEIANCIETLKDTNSNARLILENLFLKF